MARNAANLLRNQVPVNCRNYEYLTGKLAASFYASPTVGSATLDKSNVAGAAAATSGHRTFLVPYWPGNSKTPAEGPVLYSGTSTLGSTATCEMHHSDAANKGYAECGKTLSVGPLTLKFVVSAQGRVFGCKTNQTIITTRTTKQENGP